MAVFLRHAANFTVVYNQEKFAAWRKIINLFNYEKT